VLSGKQGKIKIRPDLTDGLLRARSCPCNAPPLQRPQKNTTSVTSALEMAAISFPRSSFSYAGFLVPRVFSLVSQESLLYLPPHPTFPSFSLHPTFSFLILHHPPLDPSSLFGPSTSTPRPPISSSPPNFSSPFIHANITCVCAAHLCSPFFFLNNAQSSPCLFAHLLRFYNQPTPHPNIVFNPRPPSQIYAQASNKTSSKDYCGGDPINPQVYFCIGHTLSLVSPFHNFFRHTNRIPTLILLNAVATQTYFILPLHNFLGHTNRIPTLLNAVATHSFTEKSTRQATCVGKLTMLGRECLSGCRLAPALIQLPTHLSPALLFSYRSELMLLTGPCTSFS
jgi:hypothetical protein